MFSKRLQRSNTRVCHKVLALQFPQQLTAIARERMFALTFPYTNRTFPEAERDDQFEHIFGGEGLVFLIGVLRPESMRATATHDGAGQLPCIYAHANVSYMKFNAGDEDSELPSKTRRVEHSHTALMPHKSVVVLGLSHYSFGSSNSNK